MPPSLRKSQPNLSKPSEGGSFNARSKKPSESTNPLQGLNISAERELGSAGGIKATGKLTVGVDGLISQQGVTIEADAANKTVGVGVNVGSARGKLGVNIGGRIGYGDRGEISIKGAEAGINIGGFGGSASIDDEKGIGGSISVAGAKIEVTQSPDGKKTLSLCYGVPGGELCTTFEPNPGIPDPNPISQNPPIQPGNAGFTLANLPPMNSKCTYHFHFLVHAWSEIVYNVEKNWYSGTITWEEGSFELGKGRSYITGVKPHPTNPNLSVLTHVGVGKFSENIIAFGGSGQLGYYENEPPTEPYIIVSHIRTEAIHVKGFIGKPNELSNFIQYNINGFHPGCDYFIYPEFKSCPVGESHPPAIPANHPTVIPTLFLPNYPQHYKPMDCCEKVEEIYKYLGIGKIKKKKFAVANQFLAPGATGNTECTDYYELEEAKIRMMANGMILNPVSSPNGTPWQTVNATAWAGQVYEMLAESMSDGNQTQKVETALIMQLSQMMKVIAEMKREIEFLSQCIGITPELDTEDLPICFTIFQGHKGFGKKDKKLIDITSQKTDAQVEMTLTEMLQPSKIPITVRRFKPDSISIIEALRQI
ncbi:hypothetical protein QUB47_19065 [Microcoleus sp. AT9_B5]